MGTLKEYLNSEQYDDVTTTTPAAPETPTPQTSSLVERAIEAADHLHSAALTLRHWATPERHVQPYLEMEASLRAALAAEEARDKLRREAARAFRGVDAVNNRIEDDTGPMTLIDDATLRALRAWAKMETSR